MCVKLPCCNLVFNFFYVDVFDVFRVGQVRSFLCVVLCKFSYDVLFTSGSGMGLFKDSFV